MGVKGAVIGSYAVLFMGFSSDSDICKEKRQIEVAYYFFQNLAWAGKQPLLNAASSTKLKSESYPHATRNRTTWGPFTLAPPNVSFNCL